MNLKLKPLAQIQSPKALVIGSSTGGFQAVSKIFSSFKNSNIDIPILITQHLPENFDGGFADKIAEVSGLKTKVAEENEEVTSGTILIAPASYHMSVTKSADKIRIKLLNLPQINFCKPSVDPLFSSAAKIWGANLFAIMLTGIGNDGLEGSKEIAEKGGTIIAQDEETSIVWGMPGAVAKAGICTAILPLDEIADFIKKYSYGKIR